MRYAAYCSANSRGAIPNHGRDDTTSSISIISNVPMFTYSTMTYLIAKWSSWRTSWRRSEQNKRWKMKASDPKFHESSKFCSTFLAILHWSSFQFRLFDALIFRRQLARLCGKVGDDASQRVFKLRHYPHQSSDTLTIYWTTKQRVGQLRSSHLKETRTKAPPQPICHPHTVSLAFCWWYYSLLWKWNLTPSRTHLWVE